MCALLSTTALAQTNARWSRNGDALIAGDYIGSTNTEPLLLKSNGNLGLKINTNDFVLLKSLDLNSATTNGLVLTDGQGKLSRQNFNTFTTQYLASNGTWQNLPTTQWLTNGNDLYKPTGNVGIGIVPSPFYKLDVQGDACISNNLYVGGGIIITDKVNAATEIKGQNIKVDNDLEVQNAARFNGASTFVGVTDFYQLSTFNSILRALQGVEFNAANTAGIHYNPSGKGTFSYGRQILPVNAVSCAVAHSAGANHQFGGTVQLFETNNTGNYATGGGLLNMQAFTNGQSSIDASVGGATATGGALLINYFCGSNTGINTGVLGGKVSMGKNVEIGFPSQNPSYALNVNGATNYLGLNVKTTHTVDYGYNTILQVNRDLTKALAVTNTSINKDVFTVYGNGQTQIAVNSTTPINAFEIKDIVTNTTNYTIKNNGNVYARELNVYAEGTQIPDYVFESNYKLRTLDELEVYININKHLPEIPSAKDVDSRGGFSINEMNLKLLQKVEELTLYIIAQQKEINLLKQK